jgi:transcriptional regulator with XRE-family HTH domain
MDATQNIIIPAQIRAARALLDWSQDKLASAAGVGISTVRDVESQRRPLDTLAATEIVLALRNDGVIFLPSAEEEGPGVRLTAGRPHIIKPPTVMTMYDLMPLVVEWRGKRITVFLHRETLDDLGELRRKASDADYLAIFEKHRGAILDGVSTALANGEADERGHLHLKVKFIAGFET